MKIYFSKAGRFRFALQRVLEGALKHLGQPSSQLEMSLSFVAPEEIAHLNAIFRSNSNVTDVLSFPSFDAGRKVIDVKNLPQADCSTGKINIGDVAICLQRAKEQAQDYGHSVKREVCFLALHGLLHLLGYDHETAQDEEQMTAIQREILQQQHLTK